MFKIDIYIYQVDDYTQDVEIVYNEGIVQLRVNVADRVELARKLRDAAEQLMTGLDNLE